eukprot:TRINITY_DN25006_c0_g1_i1.p1 TRINITY_DN25006_c0_g1~~TRINITY_DN25006_c0_g1_i1.p1  ORF type:complete len:271 (-),score=45.51 TRINITY_DN25006_c0_g1_i1:55-867(-)
MSRSFENFASTWNSYAAKDPERGADSSGGSNGAASPNGGTAAAGAAAAVGGWMSRLSAATGVQIPDAVTGAARDVAGAGAELSNVFGVSQGLAGMASIAGKAKVAAKSAATTVQENAISRERWMYFFGGAALGAFMMSLAFMFLPMIVFAPQKFALLYTLGSLCFMGSFSALRGHIAFFKYLLSRERLLFSITYVSSLLGTLWASLVYRSYLLTIVFVAAQVIALSWFLLSYIPGGRRAFGLMLSMAWRMMKGCLRLCGASGGGRSALPF